MKTHRRHLGQFKITETCIDTQQKQQFTNDSLLIIVVNMMEHYEIPSPDSARETVSVEMNNLPEADNGGVSPEVVYVKVKLKGKDYMCCSVFNIMFCNCLFLGFAALICSLKVSEITTLLSRITC